MDPALYVRIEGVNLDNFIADVHDLSTIRGGSFLLLDAIRRVQTRFVLTPISTGASSGLFVRPRNDFPEVNAKVLRSEIESFLNGNDPAPGPDGEAGQLRHATFVVDVYEGDESEEGFTRARESLAAMNRWRQFQQPTIAVPSPARTLEECGFDRVRPRSGELWVRENEKDVRKAASASVIARRKFGRDQKKSFYAREMRELAASVEQEQSGEEEVKAIRNLARTMSEAEFAHDLEDLAADQRRKSLDGKMAIIYFDGNRFGSIQKLCGRKDLEKFDQTVKRYRRTALRRLLEEITSSGEEWHTPADTIRLETLLWGGDELIWVVPAWQGWRVLQLFYETSRDWEFPAIGTGESNPLTHAGGVVFCHRVAPIHRMTSLAKKLADSCKQTFKRAPEPPNTHAGRDLFAYQVLESFDHTGTDFGKFRESRVPPKRSVNELIVRGEGMAIALGDFAGVRSSFPRSKLHAILAALRDSEAVDTLVEATIAELPVAGRRSLAALCRFFAPPFRGESPDKTPWKTTPTVWYHIAELWDYAI